MENVIENIINLNKDIFGENPKTEKINVGFTNTIYDVDNKFIIKICTNTNNEENFKKEIEFYKSNKNNDLIPTLYYSSTDKKEIPYFYEIIEKVEGVTLYNVWHTFTEKQREDVIRQLCDAMKYMHANKGESYNWIDYLKNKFVPLFEQAKKQKLFDDDEVNLLENVYACFEQYLESNEFVLIHNDLHFDNIFINDGKIKIIDFERSIYAPKDFELDILYRMIRKPWKFASDETEQFTDEKYYSNIMTYIEKYYPELINIDNLYKRLSIYDMIYFLDHYVKNPEYEDLKEDVLKAANIVIANNKNLRRDKMKIKKFNKNEDYERIVKFLTEQYKINKTMVCWLPERFDDLIFRIDTLYHDERGLEKSQDYIYIFEDNNEIVGVILPDGDSFNSCIKNGYEKIFSQMLDLSEKELQPLFERDDNGEINFLVVSHDSLGYQTEELQRRGYVRDEVGDFDNVAKPLETNYEIKLPEGFRQVYGYDYPDIVKMRACHYGFHPADDDGNLYKEYAEGGKSYHARKQSRYFPDSFESLIVTDDGDVCAYSFCYVDKETSTAFVEPVSTREKYRGKGLCKAMMHGIINKCKEMGIERAYVNSYDWRKKVYNSAGFETEDSIGFWYKKIR